MRGWHRPGSVAAIGRHRKHIAFGLGDGNDPHGDRPADRYAARRRTAVLRDFRKRGQPRSCRSRKPDRGADHRRRRQRDDDRLRNRGGQRHLRGRDRYAAHSPAGDQGRLPVERGAGHPRGDRGDAPGQRHDPRLGRCPRAGRSVRRGLRQRNGRAGRWCARHAGRCRHRIARHRVCRKRRNFVAVERHHRTAGDRRIGPRGADGAGRILVPADDAGALPPRCRTAGALHRAVHRAARCDRPRAAPRWPPLCGARRLVRRYLRARHARSLRSRYSGRSSGGRPGARQNRVAAACCARRSRVLHADRGQQRCRAYPPRCDVGRHAFALAAAAPRFGPHQWRRRPASCYRVARRPHHHYRAGRHSRRHDHACHLCHERARRRASGPRGQHRDRRRRAGPRNARAGGRRYRPRRHRRPHDDHRPRDRRRLHPPRSRSPRYPRRARDARRRQLCADRC